MILLPPSSGTILKVLKRIFADHSPTKMEFRIASTFTDSLTQLTNTEQTAVKSTVYDLQANPANPGLQFHRLDKPKDPNFWSVRAGQDIRLIVHRIDSSILVCYVDHHDKAYRWAEKRKLE